VSRQLGIEGIGDVWMLALHNCSKGSKLHVG